MTELLDIPARAAALLPLAANPLQNPLIPIVIVFMIFYFLVIRPQGRERKAKEEKIKAIGKNTKVVTNAGIHGTVVATDDETVTLRVDDKNNVRIRFAKAAIWQILDEEGASAGK